MASAALHPAVAARSRGQDDYVRARAASPRTCPGPRIALRLTEAPVGGPSRLAGVGTIDQIVDDLDQLRLLGTEAVVLDPYDGDPRETCHPQKAWQALDTVATHLYSPRTRTEPT